MPLMRACDITQRSGARFDLMRVQPRKMFGGCLGCFVVVLVMNLTVGGVCCDFALWYCFGVNIPWWGDVLCGLVGGELFVPAAIIAIILHGCGVPIPFFTG